MIDERAVTKVRYVFTDNEGYLMDEGRCTVYLNGAVPDRVQFPDATRAAEIEYTGRDAEGWPFYLIKQSTGGISLDPLEFDPDTGRQQF